MMTFNVILKLQIKDSYCFIVLLVLILNAVENMKTVKKSWKKVVFCLDKTDWGDFFYLMVFKNDLFLLHITYYIVVGKIIQMFYDSIIILLNFHTFC